MSDPLFDIDQVVALAAPTHANGQVFAEGTEGVIVGILDNGAYLVCLLEPRAERIEAQAEMLLVVDA